MIKLSFFNLFRRKTRTALSISGIAIGVAAIIILVSLVDGFTQDFDDVIGQFKAIMVLEKDAQDQTLSKLKTSFGPKFETIPNVKAAIPEIWVMPQKIDGSPVVLDSLAVVTIYGLDTDKFFSSGIKGWIGDIKKGKTIDSSDTKGAVIGQKIVDDYQKFVGSTIKIDGQKFRVHGIFNSESDFVSGMIVVNLEDARDLSSLAPGYVHSYSIFLDDTTKDTQVANILKLKYSEDITVFTQEDMAQQMEDIIGNLKLMAIAVALISSVVAGIGIMNTILMSVLERFKEIGALKAVGWTDNNVMRMIMYEAFFLGVFGGILGIFLGFGVDIFLFSIAGVKYQITPLLVITSFSFAISLGLIAGLYPAYMASKLSPIEALRS